MICPRMKYKVVQVADIFNKFIKSKCHLPLGGDGQQNNCENDKLPSKSQKTRKKVEPATSLLMNVQKNDETESEDVDDYLLVNQTVVKANDQEMNQFDHIKIKPKQTTNICLWVNHDDSAKDSWILSLVEKSKFS